MKYIFITVIFLFFPTIVSAQIIISEVMYDVSGTDTGYEWIEVYNSYPESVDLATYKLFENNVNHKISSEVDSILPSNKYAIIADNTVKFLEQNPTYKGMLLDSAFSLNNTGETISIYDAEGQLEDTFTYISDLGANGTGNSLQRADGVIIVASSTIGLENATVAVSEDEAEDGAGSTSGSGSSGSGSGVSQSDSVSTHSSQIPLTKFELPPGLKIGAGRDREVTVHTPIKFNILSDPSVGRIKNVKWSFGDGKSGTGANIKHTYKFPGQYIVIVNANKGDSSGVSRVRVDVISPQLSAIFKDGVEQYLDIENLGDSEVNVGEYFLEFNSKGQVFAPDTIIAPKSKISIALEDMSFIDNLRQNGLYFPDGKIVTDITYDIKDITFDTETIHKMCNELVLLGVSCQI